MAAVDIQNERATIARCRGAGYRKAYPEQIGRIFDITTLAEIHR